MILIKKYWPLLVFILLTAKISHDSNAIKYDRLVQGLDVSYGIWPTIKYQEDGSLKGAPEQKNILQFRGDVERQGWTEGSLKGKYSVAWRFDNFNHQIHGAAKGSPIVDEEGIYIGSDTGWFYCFDLNGKIKWRIFNELALRGIHGTPVIDGDFVFFGDYAGYIHAVNKHSGELLWQRRLGMTLGASPLVLGDFIYANVELAPANGFIAKVNKRSGDLVFKSAMLGEQSHSSPAYDQKTRHIIFGTNNNILYSMDIDTGSFGWSHLAKNKIKSTPVLYQNRTYYTDWTPELVANNTQTGMPEFAISLRSRSHSSPALLKNSIIAMDRNQIYQVSLDGKLLKTLDIKNTEHMGSPLVVRDGERETLLFVCHDKSLCTTDSSLGNLKEIYKGSSLISSVPFIYKNLIIFAENDGALIALRSEGP